MHLLADFILAVADLLELEGRALKRGVVKVAIACAVVCVVLLFMVAGFGLVVWGIYAALMGPLGHVGAGLLTGAISLLLATIGLLIARQIVR